MPTSESQLETQLIHKLISLKYEHRADIRDRATLEENFREKFQALNRVSLTDGEFQRLLDEIVTPDVFTAARTLRERNSFTRDDGTPLNYTLVNIKDWCKNTFEVVNQLRINTDNSHHRYDVILLINGVPVVQIELKTLGISPRRAMEQIVEYKNDPGNGYTKTLLCFLQLFIVSNRDRHLVLRQQQRPPFRLQRRRALPARLSVRRRGQQEDHPPRRASPRRFLAKCTLGQMISRYMVLVASEQKLLMMRPYQIYAVKHIVEVHRREQRQRLHLAHHRQRQDAHLLQGLHAAQGQRRHRQVPLRRRPQGPRPADARGVQPLPGRLRRGEHQHRRPRPPPALRRLRRQGHRHHHPEARPRAGRKQQAQQAAEKGRPAKPTRSSSSRCATSASSSSSTSATARSSARTTRPSRSSSRKRPALRLHRHAHLRGKRQRSRRSRTMQASMQTTEDLFQKQLHAYTITHAIEDGNVLRFHVDYYKPEGQEPAQARRGARQAGRHRGHPRQARRRHRRAPVQCPARHRLHQRRHRILQPVQDRCRRRSRPPIPTSSR